MVAILLLPVRIVLALTANRVRASADWLENHNRENTRLYDRLESWHEHIMFLLIWMEEI